MIVTNLRIPEYEYMQAKQVASEQGISMNKYITRLLRRHVVQQQLGIRDTEKRKKKRSIWDIAKLANLPRKPMGASKEDEIIYGI